MTTLLYSLHSGNLYGTERMALATALGLADEYETVFIAPEGPIHDEVARHGFRTLLFENPRKYLADIRPFFVNNQKVACIGTRVVHTLAAEFWTRVYERSCANIQVVHGGTNEKLSYGRKRWLNHLGVKQVAVSNYVRERMAAHGSDADSITVIENFLTPDRVENAPRRRPFDGTPLRKVAIVSRLDPIKRIDVLLDALDLDPSLSALEFEIYGTGSDAELLQSRALAKNPNVRFMGFCPDVAERVAHADIMLHLCPEEPFGLAILEGMASGLVVLTPDSGGAGAIIEPGKNGFHFRANDAVDLARKLHQLRRTPADELQNVVAEGMRSLRTRFSSDWGIAGYRTLIERCLN